MQTKRNKVTEASMAKSIFPELVWANILSFLDLFDSCRLRRVSKELNEVILKNNSQVQIVKEYQKLLAGQLEIATACTIIEGNEELVEDKS